MRSVTSSTTKKKPPKLLPTSALSRDQHAAITRLYEHDHTLLIAKMGAGKTVVALMAITELIADYCLNRVLIVAPKKVADDTWAKEYQKWENCEHLNFQFATGTEPQRIKAVETDSDVLVVNIENLPWLFKTFKKEHGCDGLIIDELSKFKTAGSKGVKSLRRRLNDFKWRVGMTGTPVSEDYVGLYSQALIVDGGKALGTDKQRYLETYFFSVDYYQRDWALRVGAAEAIAGRLNPIVHVMPDYRESLPPITYHDVVVELPDFARKVYDQFKRDAVVELDGREIAAVNAAVLTGKLQQVASGFVYDTENQEGAVLHDMKFEALLDLIDTLDSPPLVVYWYNYDLDSLKEALGYPVVAEAKSKTRLNALVSQWNDGELEGLLLHPRSGGHGLNLAQGGHTVIWYGPQWSRDLWEQTNARLWRTGQVNPVRVYTIVAKNTVDELVTARVEDKAEFDVMLIDHLLS